MVMEYCPHRYEVSISFSVIGIGKTKEDAVQDGLVYALSDYSSLKDQFTVSNVELAQDMDTCDLCEEEE